MQLQAPEPFLLPLPAFQVLQAADGPDPTIFFRAGKVTMLTLITERDGLLFVA